MLTEQEAKRIFAWLPYRDDWPVDRNKLNDNIDGYYGNLIKEFSDNNFFSSYNSDDGGLSNYLGFVCYPSSNETYIGNAIFVLLSLCSPIAAYGQISVEKRMGSFGYSFFAAENVGNINDSKLANIETVIKSIFERHAISVLDKEFACKLLPDEIAESLKHENHNEGKQYLHGLFQVTD